MNDKDFEAMGERLFISFMSHKFTTPHRRDALMELVSWWLKNGSTFMYDKKKVEFVEAVVEEYMAKEGD